MSPCPHCTSKEPVEVAGQRLHTFPDRWIPCIGTDQKPMRVHVFAKAVLWLQLVVPFHHVHHLFHLFRSRF
jgi:hypothetical protein